MPDLPPSKRIPSIQPPPASAPHQRRYAELHCRTNFSFLEGASHPDELALRAAELGYAALAITDRNSLAGVVRAHDAAKQLGLKLLIGAELTPQDAPPLIVLATDRAAYARLCRLLTHGRRNAPKGECHLSFTDLAEHAEGLLGLVPLVRLLGQAEPERELFRYRSLFGDRCYAIAERHLGSDDERRMRQMQSLARTGRLPLVVANDVHYHVSQRRYLQDVLTAIRHGCPVADLGERLFPNGERSLKSPDEMEALFPDCREAVARTVEVADRCHFSLDELRYEYPEELAPPELSPLEHLTKLTWDGAANRYPTGIPEKVRDLIEYELQLIAELKYEAYFLTVWDLVRFARSRSILCQGRGSAANSAVCFCLGVTSVDPKRIDVLFERFISKERNEAPDIDVDFEHERREEVIQYVYEKYGRQRAGMTAVVITYRGKSAVRDVGKALGLSPDRVDSLSKLLDHYRDEDTLAVRFREAGLNMHARLSRQLLALVRELVGFPRHLSQHPGGLVITRGPLCELVPIENATMPGRTVVEWDKNDLDTLGILKVDCLALGMLTAIRKGFDLIERHYGPALTLATVPAEDPQVYEMACRADTMGVFQIESRAQMAMLPRLKPQCFYDLVIEIALVRPGPIQGDMVHPYLRRRTGEEGVDYPDERVRGVLEKTLGVPLFQEQAMKLAVVAAGFTPGEADQLRRAMGAWRKKGIIDQFQKKLIAGMQANGYSLEFAERLFSQIRGFGEYGFPESHSASFALLVYVSAWMKRHYPAAFTAALLNSQPMGFYAPAQLVGDARKHGVEVLPVEINASHWDCTLEGTALRLGFRMLRGLSQRHGEQIFLARADGEFTSYQDFVRRTGLQAAALAQLARGDVFRSLYMNRRAALWQSLPDQRSLSLFANTETDEPPVPLPAHSPQQHVTADYQASGLSLRDHPLKFLRQWLNEQKIVTTAELAHLLENRRYRVAGLVLMRQRPGTASGITFVTLEDETGIANLIVHPKTWERYHQVARVSAAWIAHGTLQRQDSVIHLLVHRLEDLSKRLGQLEVQSRDFR